MADILKAGQCPLCKKDVQEQLVSSNDAHSFACMSCGNVIIHRSFIPEHYERVLHILSGWTRERTEKQEKPLPILSDNAPPATEGITVQAILKLPSIPANIGEQIVKLLMAIQRKSRYFGEEIDLSSEKDYTLAHLEHNNTIMDEMIACIRKSRFMIADLTYQNQNQNVYFEAGFAQGMGIPVIYTCHQDSVDNIMFDTQHSNQIRWTEFDELRTKFRNRILATIG